LREIDSLKSLKTKTKELKTSRLKNVLKIKKSKYQKFYQKRSQLLNHLRSEEKNENRKE
jgi:hypothetical protein